MVNADPFLSGAIDVAAELATAAHWGHQGPTWRGRDVSHEPSGNWQIIDATIGSDLYAGTAGLARLFAGVSAVVAADGYRDLATRTARQAVGTELEQGDTTGWFSGGLGVAATGAAIGQRLGDPELVAQSQQLIGKVLARLDEALPADTDLVDGLAGHVLGLSSAADTISDHALSARSLTTAAILADEIVRRARIEPWGWSWPTAISEHGLASLAHGGSGIGLSLIELGVRLHRCDLVAGGFEAFRGERSWLSTERPGWPDLRTHFGMQPNGAVIPLDRSTPPGSVGHLVTALWCHGSAGIGLARLRAYELTRDPIALGEASAALESARRHVSDAAGTIRNGQPSDVSLCHGLGGALELYLTASKTLHTPEHLRAARRVAALIMESRQNQGRFVCGLPDGSTTPGLFCGLAGIGASLLRVAAPHAMTSPALVGV